MRLIDSPFSCVAAKLQRDRTIGPVTIEPENLPDDIAALQAALAAEREARQQAEARAASAEALIAHYKQLIAKLDASSTGNPPNAAASCSANWSCNSRRRWRVRPRTKSPRNRLGALR